MDKEKGSTSRVSMEDLNPILKSIGFIPELKDYCKRRGLHQLIYMPQSFIFLGVVGSDEVKDTKEAERWESRITAAFASAAMGFAEAEQSLALPVPSPRTFSVVTNGSATGVAGIANRVARSLANWKILAISPLGQYSKEFPVAVRVPVSAANWAETFLRHVDIVLCVDTDMDTGAVPKFLI